MTNAVLLNNIDHKDLKVKTLYSEEYGDGVASTLTFPTEFGDVQKEYPILFQKNTETEKYQSIALFGFKKGENLFLSKGGNSHSNGWNANYVPGVIARGPFLIGFQDQSADGGSEKAPVVHVDMDSPRVGIEEGESVFREFGGNSPYLERVNSILEGIHQGMEVSDAMFAAFEHFELIEPITINIELNNGEKYSLQGNYTISEEKLAGLDGDSLAKLNASGFLQGAFMVVSSLSNMKKLIDIKNNQI